MPTLIAIDSQASIEAFQLASEKRLRREFISAVQNVKNEATISELSVLIERGLINEALVLASSIPVVIASAVNSTVIRSGEETARTISEATNSTVKYDISSNRAVNIMRNNRLRLVREFTNGQRDATRAAIVDGLQRGINPRDQARAFRGSIGLTERQVGHVNNYRRLLVSNSSEALNRRLRDKRFDSTIRRSINDNTQLSKTQIDKMVTRYQSRFVKHRAEVIARTEALTALNEANEAMYQQAYDDGVINPTDIINQWVTAGDARVRDSHRGMNGQERKEGQPFLSDNGNLLLYPGDRNAPRSETIQCRCSKIRLFS